MSGLLFAFSNFVMKALGQLPATSGMDAMQRINVAIVNPLFICIFLGTTALCAALVFLGVLGRSQPGLTPITIGALCYLVGAFGITVFCNVPLNHALAGVDPSAAANQWPTYLVRWQAWNHARTVITVAATGFMAYGLAQLGAAKP